MIRSHSHPTECAGFRSYCCEMDFLRTAGRTEIATTNPAGVSPSSGLHGANHVDARKILIMETPALSADPSAAVAGNHAAAGPS